MCSHHRPTRDDQLFLKKLAILPWLKCELCVKREVPINKKLRTEEETDGA